MDKVGECVPSRGNSAWGDREMWASTAGAGSSQVIRYRWIVKYKGHCQVWLCQGRLWNLFLLRLENQNEAFMSLGLVWVVFLPEVGAYTIYVREKSMTIL